MDQVRYGVMRRWRVRREKALVQSVFGVYGGQCGDSEGCPVLFLPVWWSHWWPYEPLPAADRVTIFHALCRMGGHIWT